MPEREFELKQIGVDYICDSCNTGVMSQTGGPMLMSNPPKFEHQCSHCSTIRHFTEKYPTVRFQRLPAY